MKIALAGNPNSGKTTIYNVLTGKNEHVGNWAGVTVDKKEAMIKQSFCPSGEKIIVVDLPGAYSISPFTAEESVTRDYIREEMPDVIVNVVDATNLARSLFFTSQLLELGIPMVVALNKSDVRKKQNLQIDVRRLSEFLGCPVLETRGAVSGAKDMEILVSEAMAQKGEKQIPPYAQKDVDVFDKEAVKQADRERFAFVNRVVEETTKREDVSIDKTRQDMVDRVLTTPWVGIPVFALVMFLVFFISQTTLGSMIAEVFAEGIEAFQGWVSQKVSGADPFLQALLVDGMIGGVGAVLGFLPLVMIMYFLIALLEDCGYMARATALLDPVFKKVGLSGKAVIPMVIGTGCAIPGIMACRTIRNKQERRTAAMLTPFMPCGAKLPVIALFSGAFFADAPWVGTVMYFTGILLILFGAFLVNRITGYAYKKSYFIIELPDYKLPDLKLATMSMLSRGKEYIVKAGTVILLCNTVVQIMQEFNWKLQMVEDGMETTSILATIASPLSVILLPIAGVAAWQLAAASVTGCIAKENIVGTLAVCYGLTSFIDTQEFALTGGQTQVAAVMGLTKVAALAYLMFNLFIPPCFAALGAMNAELEDKKWFWGGVAFQFAIGYGVAFCVYQIGTLIETGKFGAGFAGGLTVVISLAAVILLLIARAKKRMKMKTEVTIG